jgi:hypothetical protein
MFSDAVDKKEARRLSKLYKFGLALEQADTDRKKGLADGSLKEITDPNRCEKSDRPSGPTALLAEKAQWVVAWQLHHFEVIKYCGGMVDMGPNVKPQQPQHMGDTMTKMAWQRKVKEKRTHVLDLATLHSDPKREDKHYAAAAEAKKHLIESARNRETIRLEDLDAHVKAKFKHGFNNFTWPDGTGYDGQWRGGVPEGTGYMWWANGAKYEGQFKNGKPEGTGTKKWADGQIYKGPFRQGTMEGQGVLTWADGKKYSGLFKEGKVYGHGTMTWPDGRRSEGEFNDDDLKYPAAVLVQSYARRKLAYTGVTRKIEPRPCPPSLMALCLRHIARRVVSDPKTYSTSLIKERFPRHMKLGLAFALMADLDGISDHFRAIVPTIAWVEGNDHVAFTGGRPTPTDISMLSYFLRTSDNISKLELQWNHLGPAGAINIAKFMQGNSTLTAVDISWNAIGYDGALAVARALDQSPKVRTISLAGNGLGERGGQAVAEWLKEPQCSAITLDLSFNELGTVGGMAIADALRVNRTLTNLNLRMNELGPAGGAALVDALRLNEGTCNGLIVTDNHIGQEAAAALARISKGTVRERMNMLGHPRSSNLDVVKLIRGDYVLGTGKNGLLSSSVFAEPSGRAGKKAAKKRQAVAAGGGAGGLRALKQSDGVAGAASDDAGASSSDSEDEGDPNQDRNAQEVPKLRMKKLVRRPSFIKDGQTY